MKKYLIFHPLLFAVYPVLFLFTENISEMSLSNIWNSLLVVVISAIFLIFVINLTTKNPRKTALIISLLAVLSFSYGYMAEISGWADGFLLSLWALIFAGSLFFIVKTNNNLKNITRILNFTASALILVNMYNIAAYEIKTKDNPKFINSNIKTEISAESGKTAGNLPDIYFIILDRYANSKNLKTYYNIDNSEFTDYLKNTGFYVAEDSRSNYIDTSHSLASSLNMEHLAHFTEEYAEERSLAPLFNRINNEYAVWQFLKAKGYIYVHSGSWWPPTNKNKTADINVNHYRTTDFSILLYSQTVFFPITTKLGLNLNLFRSLNKYYYCYDTTISQLKSLELVPKIKVPTYTFTHLLITHSPYVFDENGNFIYGVSIPAEKNKESYNRALIFTNKKIKELVDKIISQSEIPPVIILQADEGPFPDRWIGGDKTDLSWKDETKEGLSLKTGILNALYLPGVDTSDLYSDFSPVNTFRYIFNKYFEAGFDLLPDTTYAHTDNNHPYVFFEI